MAVVALVMSRLSTGFARRDSLRLQGRCDALQPAMTTFLVRSHWAASPENPQFTVMNELEY